MSREQLRELARETVEISRAGRYTVDGQVILFDAARPTELWTAQDLDSLVRETARPAEGPAAAIEVRGEGTVDAIFRLSGGARLCPKMGVLDFASAKNPGGGFLNGAMAQEESLAASGGLYRTLTPHEGYYRRNRACGTMMYTGCAIYSPDVVFFRDEKFRLLPRPVTASVLTLPAVNLGQVMQTGEDLPAA